MENQEWAGQAVVASLALIERAEAARLEPIDLLLPARQVWMVAVEPANSARTRVAAELAETQVLRRARAVFRQVVLPPGVVLPLRIGSEGEVAVLLARVALTLTGLARAAVVVERQDQRYRRCRG